MSDKNKKETVEQVLSRIIELGNQPGALRYEHTEDIEKKLKEIEEKKQKRLQSTLSKELMETVFR